MSGRVLLPLVGLLTVGACESAGGASGAPDAGAPPDTGAAPDSAAVAADAADAPQADPVWPPVLPDPAAYDCRAAGGPPPERRSQVPLSCVTDPACRERMVVGHRGMGGNLGRTAPENSLAAIRAAIVAGADGVEVDVLHTADDVLVTIHDDTVDRTLEGRGDVESLTLAELQALPMRTAAALVTEYPGDFSCERVPTFAEVLALARGRLFLDVDVKTDRAAEVARAIRDADMLDHAFFSTGSLDKLVAAREAVPGLAVQARPSTTEEVEEWVAALDRPPEIFEMGWGELEPALERIRALGAKTFMDAFLQDVEALQGHFSGYERVWDQGVDIIQTDTPLVLLHSLDRLPEDG